MAISRTRHPLLRCRQPVRSGSPGMGLEVPARPFDVNRQGEGEGEGEGDGEGKRERGSGGQGKEVSKRAKTFLNANLRVIWVDKWIILVRSPPFQAKRKPKISG
eukprot:3939409-Rhodomonas_salina.2